MEQTKHPIVCVVTTDAEGRPMIKRKLIVSGTNKSEDVPAIYSDASWSVFLSAKGDSLIIQTTDYHASPLMLPLAALEMVVKLHSEPAASIKRGAIPSTPDAIEVGRQGRFILTISKKDKCLLVETNDHPDGPLKLSRKELYAIGKIMNKRVKRSEHILG